MKKWLLAHRALAVWVFAISTLINVGVALPSCGKNNTQHVVVVADTALYEVLNDAHQVEQKSLCGQPSCAGVPEKPVPGWSHDKSVAFNRALLPAVEGGRQLNVELAKWVPGQPLPAQVKAVINSISAALKNVIADFPAGTTKDTVLQDIGQAQAIILNALDLYLTVKGG